jgi:hypothetical protein
MVSSGAASEAGAEVAATCVDPYFDDAVQKLTVTHPQLVPSGSMTVKVINGVINVKCAPCSVKKDKLIEAGGKEKSLSNVKAHLKRDTHVKNLTNYLEKNKKKQETETFSDKIERVKSEVEKTCPGNFIVVKTGLLQQSKLRCALCNVMIAIFPQRGDACFNAQQHYAIHKCDGEQNTNGKQQSLDSFFKAVPKSSS